MAQDFDKQVFANQNVKAIELSQTEMKETQGEVLPLIAWGLGGAAIGMWAEHGKSLYTTGKPASVHEVTKAGVNGAVAGTIGRIGATRWSVPKIGGEINIGKNIRIAPIGNSTGHPIGKFPHYHRRGLDQLGNTKPGQGIGRHRPWESKPSDKSWRDRF
ncbi:hypothetical protein [Wielerella bovis]|uniref:hypothetical protein n=1 Tax=Wielerella bovis TaxID=2917790 RepID=UPI002018F76E|nr:hypothetical protein [Wielerella bovis]MCG7656144.1 hypothetical protein [Wielerella bovis]MCG7658369.1 hypothetical protein [Wielerella bovis]